MKTKNNDSLITSFVKLICRIFEFLKYHATQKDQEQKRLEIEKAKLELKKALAEGRINDAAYWKEKLMQLSSIILAIIIFGMSGCITQTQNDFPVVIGERIIKVKPGDLIKVPQLTAPAKQWYLVDDVGLYQWIDIGLPKK